MQINAMTSAGLPATAEAIRRGQARFDDSAARVVHDTMAAAAESPSENNLVGDLVTMKVDSLTNSILYGVFKRQSEQQKEMLDIVKPKE